MQSCCERFEFVATGIISNFPIFPPSRSLSPTRRPFSIWGYLLCSWCYSDAFNLSARSYVNSSGGRETLQLSPLARKVIKRNCILILFSRIFAFKGNVISRRKIAETFVKVCCEITTESHGLMETFSDSAGTISALKNPIMSKYIFEFCDPAWPGTEKACMERAAVNSFCLFLIFDILL